jgi:hypothetical protein
MNDPRKALRDLIRKMLRQDGLRMGAAVKIEGFDADGKLVFEHEAHNKTVNGGLALVAQILAGLTGVPTWYSAVGTDATPAAAAQTALVAQYGSRVTNTPTNTTVNITNDTMQIVVNHTITGQTIQEAGLFTLATGGTMLDRVTWTPATTGVTTLTLTWSFSIASST